MHADSVMIYSHNIHLMRTIRTLPYDQKGRLVYQPDLRLSTLSSWILGFKTRFQLLAYNIRFCALVMLDTDTILLLCFPFHCGITRFHDFQGNFRLCIWQLPPANLYETVRNSLFAFQDAWTSLTGQTKTQICDPCTCSRTLAESDWLWNIKVHNRWLSLSEDNHHTSPL